MRLRYHRAFTLLELMVVIAIIGILSTLAVPSLQKYLFRARVLEGVHLAEAAELAIDDYHQTEGKWPSSNTEAGLGNLKGNNVSAVDIKSDGSGGIVVTYSDQFPAIANQTLEFNPSFDEENQLIAWDCKGGTLKNDYRPSECRN